ncbi:hypothetical protein ACIPL1_15915 [Pseudomonas sp. NPDC090202]|uniref:hypothetical protein n=1 Tax=unclassified Pseudomonas TaxID=196821 RepID=UPI00382A75D5
MLKSIHDYTLAISALLMLLTFPMGIYLGYFKSRKILKLLEKSASGQESSFFWGVRGRFMFLGNINEILNNPTGCRHGLGADLEEVKNFPDILKWQIRLTCWGGWACLIAGLAAWLTEKTM